MSCPTCDYEMLCVGEEEPGVGLWYCELCGTLKANIARSFHRVPALVETVRSAIKTPGIVSGPTKERFQDYVTLLVRPSGQTDDET